MQDIEPALSRRNFLSATGASLAALPIPNLTATPKDAAQTSATANAAPIADDRKADGWWSRLRAFVAELKSSAGAGMVGYLPMAEGRSRSVQDKLRDVVSVRDFGAIGDGITDDSAAVASAVAYASTPIAKQYCRGLHFPSGQYLITQNNWLGANLKTVGVFSGRLDIALYGDGRNSSVILFRPSVSGGACFDQTATPTAMLGGFDVQNLGFLLDNSANGRRPIHFIISSAAPGYASQNFRLRNTRFLGVAGSVLFDLKGTVNEDVISVSDTTLDNFASALVSNSNHEAVLHQFYALDCLNITGTLFEYRRGGCLKVFGGCVIMEGTPGTDTAILKSTGGTTGQYYAFDSVRTELRGANTRLLDLPIASENTISFTNCVVGNVAHQQAWATAVAQHHATIVFDKCILPRRTGTGSAGTFQLTNCTSGTDYATSEGAHTFIRFVDCDNSGSRLDDVDGWVDFSHLDKKNANYSTLQVTYSRCGNLPDSVEYGHPYRLGRTFVPNSPQKMVFRGTTFPYGDGTAPVLDGSDFNIVVPRFNFVSEIVIMRAAMQTETLYQIQFIDTAERNAPGSGIIFGQTGPLPNNQPITQRVAILRQFYGSRPQRTIWCRINQGFSLGAGRTGDAAVGGIYAELF